MADFLNKIRYFAKTLSVENFQKVSEMKENLKEKGLATVCQSAGCPNINECWSGGTSTIMLLGDVCTRACRFCKVKTGNPQMFLDPKEPEKVSEMIGLMKHLRYIVLTSVDRDDLQDGGSEQFAKVISRLKNDFPELSIEALIPDFDAVEENMHVLAQSRPLVIAQNMETVKRLTHPVRDVRAGYDKTLKALKFYKENYPEIYTKTSLMVGLGENKEELLQTMDDLREVGCDIITFGQYLQPSKFHWKIDRFYPPEEFVELKEIAYQKGFKFVASGALVRSSYKASDFLEFLEKDAQNKVRL